MQALGPVLADKLCRPIEFLDEVRLHPMLLKLGFAALMILQTLGVAGETNAQQSYQFQVITDQQPEGAQEGGSNIICITQNARLRPEPNTNKDPLGIVTAGTETIIIESVLDEDGSPWYRISQNGIVGFVWSGLADSGTCPELPAGVANFTPQDDESLPTGGFWEGADGPLNVRIFSEINGVGPVIATLGQGGMPNALPADDFNNNGFPEIVYDRSRWWLLVKTLNPAVEGTYMTAAIALSLAQNTGGQELPAATATAVTPENPENTGPLTINLTSNGLYGGGEAPHNDYIAVYDTFNGHYIIMVGNNYNTLTLDGIDGLELNPWAIGTIVNIAGGIGGHEKFCVISYLGLFNNDSADRDNPLAPDRTRNILYHIKYNYLQGTPDAPMYFGKTSNQQTGQAHLWVFSPC